MNSKAGRCCTVKKQNDAKSPGGQSCVVRFHREDGGVVQRIQLATEELLARSDFLRITLSQMKRLRQGVLIAIRS